MPARKQPTNLKLSPEVGIRSLKDLTKDELIYCINAAAIDECRLKWALQDIADKRQKKKWQKEDAAMAQYRKLLEELVALVSPYQGKELPRDVALKENAIVKKMRRLGNVFCPK